MDGKVPVCRRTRLGKTKIIEEEFKMMKEKQEKKGDGGKKSKFAEQDTEKEVVIINLVDDSSGSEGSDDGCKECCDDVVVKEKYDDDDVMEECDDNGVTKESDDDDGVVKESDDDHGVVKEFDDDDGVLKESDDDHGVVKESDDDDDVTKESDDDHGVLEESDDDDDMEECDDSIMDEGRCVKSGRKVYVDKGTKIIEGEVEEVIDLDTGEVTMEKKERQISSNSNAGSRKVNYVRQVSDFSRWRIVNDDDDDDHNDDEEEEEEDDDTDDDDHYDNELSFSEEESDSKDDPDYGWEKEQEMTDLDLKGTRKKNGVSNRCKKKKNVEKEKAIDVVKLKGGVEIKNTKSRGETSREFKVRMKRKRVDRKGNNVNVVVIDSDDESSESKEHLVQRRNCVAKRTRSHSNFAEGKKKNKCDYDENDDRSFESSGNTSVPKKYSKKQVDSGKSTKTKKKRGRKSDNFINIMMNSILENEDGCLEEMIGQEDSKPQTTLPLKFFYGVEESTTCEKSPEDEEMDSLWDELAFGLASSEMGQGSSKVEDEDFAYAKVETDIAALCSRGDHQYVLDDEVGIKCRYCFFVKTHIKNVMPDFGPDIWGTRDKVGSFVEKEQSFLFGIEHQDLDDCSIHTGCDPAPAEGTVWDLIPGVRSSMFQHQRDGFEFIWKKTAGDIYIDKLKESGKNDSGGGCIISHAPGTGKSRLTIVFLQSYIKLNKQSRPLIIAPKSMLLTWEEEFRKWKVDIPFHNLNNPELSYKEHPFLLKELLNSGKVTRAAVRMLKVFSWKKGNSILGISYSLFKQMTNEGTSSNLRKEKLEKNRRILHELPGIIVFDEGHTPRNDESCIWKAVSQIKTKRRIILSGTPFQNNFLELYNTLSLAKPKFANWNNLKDDGKVEKRRGRKNNEERDKWATLANLFDKKSPSVSVKFIGDRLKEVQDIIRPFVHIHKGNILQERLPGLFHSVVLLRPTELQKRLLEEVDGKSIPFEHAVSLVSVHPSLLLETKIRETKEFAVNIQMLKKLRLNPYEGVKTKFLIELVRLSKTRKEKVLIFSQFLKPLTFVKGQLLSYFQWSEGKEVLYMDGKLDIKLRQSAINIFNDPASESRVLLASTKACSEGINLVGASRVVLLDVVWNPSVERQAISRAYRLGQKNTVYVYHLIISGTEEEKYRRQSLKDCLSKLVFSSSDCSKQAIPTAVSEDKILEEMFHHHGLKEMFEDIIRQPKESKLIDTFGFMDQPKESNF